MEDKIVQPAVLTLRQTAQYLNVSVSTIFRMLRDDQIAHIRVRHSLRFRRADLDEFLENESIMSWSPHAKSNYAAETAPAER